MAYAHSRQALLVERELLLTLESTANLYGVALPAGTLGKDIVKDWAGSFKKLAKLNYDTSRLTDTKFAAAINEDIYQLDALLDVVRGDGFGTSWRQLFTKDRAIAVSLLANAAFAQKSKTASKTTSKSKAANKSAPRKQGVKGPVRKKAAPKA